MLGLIMYLLVLNSIAEPMERAEYEFKVIQNGYEVYMPYENPKQIGFRYKLIIENYNHSSASLNYSLDTVDRIIESSSTNFSNGIFNDILPVGENHTHILEVNTICDLCEYSELIFYASDIGNITGKFYYFAISEISEPTIYSKFIQFIKNNLYVIIAGISTILMGIYTYKNREKQ